MAQFKHLSLIEHHNIERMLDERKSLSAIAKYLDRDIKTITKEIKKHRIISNYVGLGRIHNDCIHRYNCKSPKTCERCNNPNPKCGHCTVCNKLCDKFEPEICTKMDEKPYCCNGCKEKYKCTLTKKLYNAEAADKEYKKVLSESREGVSLNTEELEKLSTLIEKQVKNQHQSIHAVITNNPNEFTVCEKTIYNYIDSQLITTKNIDLARKIRLKTRKNKVHHKVDRNCTVGRTYDDFLKYCQENPGIDVVEFDSVEGPKGSCVLLTIFFRCCNLQLSFKRDSNNAKSVIDIINNIYKTIGHDNFVKLFPVILADNGTEFSNPSAIENYYEIDENTNEVINVINRTKVFYCNPSAPYQKGACERNHEFIRYFVAKGESFDNYSQDDINLMMNHINSYPRGKEKNLYIPIVRFLLLFGEAIASSLSIKLIESNQVTLNKTIFKK